MEKPTKYYSDKQETVVANYLGWKRVSASGARPFNKGDIVSEQWLCECKTHTARTVDYKVMFSVWRKIEREAMSCMKRPVLIIDNGTQKIEDQCAVIPMTFYDVPYNLLSYDMIKGNELSIRQNMKSFVFSNSVLINMVKEKYCIRVKVNDVDVVIMSIEFFKELIEH